MLDSDIESTAFRLPADPKNGIPAVESSSREDDYTSGSVGWSFASPLLLMTRKKQ